MNDKKNIPKGFHYFQGDYIKDQNYVLQKFIESSNSLYFNVVKFPPLGFSETFLKGSDITGDKVYEFQDKSNRNIMLTPDSQAHLLNYYLSGEDINKNLRYSWISPTFRYRNIPSRYFYQIGYSSINYSQEDNIFELFCLIKQISSFINIFSKNKIDITIVNPGLIKEIIEKANIENNVNLYENIRNLSKLEQLSYIDVLPDSKYKSDLIHIINGESNSIENSNLLEYDEFLNITRFIKLISNLENISSIHLNIDNIYSSQILNGIGFIIEVDKQKIGDGGIYDLYGNNFDQNIKTFASVCTGINPMIRLLKNSINITENKNIIFFTDDYYILTSNVLDLFFSFNEYGFSVDIRKKGKNNKKYFGDYSWVFYIDDVNNKQLSGILLNKKLNFSSNIENIDIIDLINKVTSFNQ